VDHNGCHMWNKASHPSGIPEFTGCKWDLCFSIFTFLYNVCRFLSFCLFVPDFFWSLYLSVLVTANTFGIFANPFWKCHLVLNVETMVYFYNTHFLPNFKKSLNMPNRVTRIRKSKDRQHNSQRSDWWWPISKQSHQRPFTGNAGFR
jgi:hypothetical protein